MMSVIKLNIINSLVGTCYFVGFWVVSVKNLLSPPADVQEQDV